MSIIKDIRKPVATEIKSFDKQFKSILNSKVPLLNTITNFLYRNKGKQMRPLFVFLSAKSLGEINKSTYTAASLIELLHTATLIHDDVVDDSLERRGFFSINALWKSKISVLIGDYLLAQGLLLSVANKEYEMLEIVSQAVKEMSEGELLQLKKTRKLNLSEADYFDIIEKKTAALIMACTKSGAKSTGADEEIMQIMSDLGKNIGLAFQIKDDLFDYEINNNTGKPSGNDVQEKKLTLPLIYSLNNCDQQARNQIIKIINRKKSDHQSLQTIVNFVHQYKGIEYARDKMNEYKSAAFSQLKKLPQNDAQESLQQLIEYTVTRNK
ncbi:MAG: polyprenyl synthetase family protein [Bacteroidetes bacterium]|jgi:octaprenyl-diphosphate synthase|nr:polyprenyl synthetase family protein [Bacteroidota bacterium]